METHRHGDMKTLTWRHGIQRKTEKGSPSDFLNSFTICTSCKRKFVVCQLVDEETNGSYPFANGLNGTDVPVYVNYCTHQFCEIMKCSFCTAGLQNIKNYGPKNSTVIVVKCGLSPTEKNFSIKQEKMGDKTCVGFLLARRGRINHRR